MYLIAMTGRKVFRFSMVFCLLIVFAFPATAQAIDIIIDSSTTPNPHTDPIVLTENHLYGFVDDIEYTISGVISGGYQLGKSGNGTLILSGQNSFTGGLNVRGGRVVLTNASAAGTGIIDLGLSSTLELAIATDEIMNNNFSGIGPVEKTGVGIVTLTGPSPDFGGGIDVKAGGMVFANGAQFNANTLTTRSGASTAIDSNTRMNVILSLTQENNSTLNLGVGASPPFISARDAELAGKLNITGFDPSLPANALTMTRHVVLHTTGSITGDFNQGVGFAGVLSGVDYLKVDGQKDPGNLDYSVGFTLAWNEDTSVAHGEFSLLHKDNTFDLDVSLADQDHRGPFNSTWNGRDFVKRGEGNLIMSAANTYTGSTTVESGPLTMNIDNAFAASTAVTINSGATLVMGGYNQTAQNLSGEGEIIGTATLTALNATDSEFKGTMDGAMKLVKTGGSALTLSGQNKHRGGTEIQAGRLIITNGSALGTGDVSVTDVLELAYTADGDLNNKITGTGTLEKTGLTAVTLKGDGSRIAVVENRAGTLAIDGGVTMTAGRYTTRDNAATMLVSGGRLTVTGALTQEDAAVLTIGIGGTEPYIIAGTANLGGRLNISGFDPALPASALTATRHTILRTGATINGNFSQVGFGGVSTGVDYLLLDGQIDSGGDTYSVGFDLTWQSTESKAHGDFTLLDANNIFEVDGPLGDRVGSFPTGWNGRDLTKKGAGTLILSAANSFSGITTVDGGTLSLRHPDALADTSRIRLSSGTLETKAAPSSAKNIDLLGDSGIKTDVDSVFHTIGGSYTIAKTGTADLTLANIAVASLDVREGGVTITGSVDLEDELVLYGDSRFEAAAINNIPTLTVHAGGNPATVSNNLDLTGKTLNFHLDGVQVGSTLLSMNGNNLAIDNSTQIMLYAHTLSLLEDDEITLVDQTTGSFTEKEYRTNMVGPGASVYDFTLWREETGTNPLLAKMNGLNPAATTERAKAYSEGKLGGLSHLKMASDLAVNRLLSHAARLEPGASGVFAFGGGKTKVKTGSHIDSNSFVLAGGVSYKKLTGGGAFFTLAFLEGGWGKYDSYNAFTTGNVHGNGDVQHYGLGVLLKQEFAPGLYLEGSIRGGRVETDFSTGDLGAGATFESASTYWGGHLGLGGALNLGKNHVVEPYLNLFHTRQGSDAIATAAGEHIHFDATHSTRLSLGARYIKEYKELTKFHAGLAWEYEFYGKQKAKINSLPIDAPDMQGSSALFELGVLHEISSHWSVDLSAQGLLGRRRGLAGNAGVRYTF
ncbi:MAG: autotransporter-associated beta strand repeat-containing protein [Planctomycetes bacterium]|nr:autotransporter-associated beta strand repeat-containing protein [Planctomycetota bacterium]